MTMKYGHFSTSKSAKDWYVFMSVSKTCVHYIIEGGGGGNLEGKVLGWEVSLTYLSDVHSLFDSRIL